ncbi:sensor histidine kinase [Clostridium sediminicola]|uniref:sensor histidine kinase n=1 Tax=Clostridium sediminicola TaxID=3114879 RepID=UPI003D16E48F
MNWILLIIIIVLSLLLFNDKKKTKMISGKLENILKEDSRERIRANNLSMDKKELVEEINIFLDRYQHVSVDNKNYKERHKKMISNISHDIRTPLTALMGYVHLLKDNTLKEDKKNEYIDIIYERGNALVELMEEFFQMAKLEGNDAELQNEKVNITEAIRQNVINFMNEINEREITMQIDIGEEEAFVLGDKSALNRVITNLISNSLKYGQDGKFVGISLNQDDKNVKLIVWDKGKGIEKDKLPYIFDRLYTAENSRNRKFQGSGLGLSIVRKLVENMDGNIIAESISNEKTSFIVTLPRYR